MLKKWGNYIFKEDIKIGECDNDVKCSKYENDKDCIVILAVGGCDCFNQGYDIIRPLVIAGQTKRFVVIIDNDDNDEQKTLKKLSFGIDLIANKWYSLEVDDDFGEKKKLDVFIKIIPDERKGALETVLIDTLGNAEPHITYSATNYIDHLTVDEAKYILKDRYKLKAKTGVIFNLLAPDKTFDSLSKKFDLIDFDDERILYNFAFLKEKLINNK